MTLIRHPLLFLFLCIYFSLALGTQTFWPAAIPLAVRTPYLNAWMYTQSTSLPSSNSWPRFWDPSILGWICYIRVDGVMYILLGSNNLNDTALGDYAPRSGTVVETQLTPTRTIQVIEAGLVNVTVTFLSPINPSDLVLQSLPFAYIAVDFSSVDNEPHDIQLYSDISGEWLYGGGVSDRAQKILWNSTETSNIVYHRIQLAQPTPFQEFDEQATDGEAYYAMALGQGRNVTWQTCQDSVCREEFIYAAGLKSKNSNEDFRNINDGYPVFAISVNLGSVTSSDAPIVWVVGYVRDPSISYTMLGQSSKLRPYYTTAYNTTEAALEFFVSDFNNSLSRSTALDAHVRDSASNISANGKLFDMLSLATRQAFGSLEIIVPQRSNNTDDTQPRILMKDMGSSRRVTPVENLYAALPMFLFYNASFIKSLLMPLLEQQNSSSGSFPYAAKDIGTSFPIVSGPNYASEESVEQTGNMLIVALAHTYYTNDTSLLHDYYQLFKTWAEFLTQNALFPVNQVSVDGPTIPSNSTNLAVKGIFAIQAMAQISHFVGADSDSQQYSSIASSFMETWRSLALSSGDDPCVQIAFGEEGTWLLPYNLYPHTLLGFDLLNQSFFNQVAVAYQRIQSESTSNNKSMYGLPSDSTFNASGNVAWNAFTAATFSDPIRAQLLDSVWEYASNNRTDAPFGAILNVESGAYISGTLSPALGGLFAPLVHGGNVLPVQSPTTSGSGAAGPGSSGGTNSPSVDAGVAVGGVVGLLALVALVLWLLRRRQHRKYMAKPTAFQSANVPAALGAEKLEREAGLSGRMNVPSLSSPSAEALPAVAGGDGRPLTNLDLRSREEVLLGLRSDIEVLRNMLITHVERPEPSELSAPPSYF